MPTFSSVHHRSRPGLLASVLALIACTMPISLAQDNPAISQRAAPAYSDHNQLMVVRDGTGREQPIRSIADWNVRRDHILAHFQEVTGPLPGGERRVPLDVQVISTTKEPEFTRKKITFAVEPGDRVPAWLLVPDQAGKPAIRKPAALCLHQTIAIGKDEPAGLGQNRELAYARELAERGYVALAPDYPNFGEYKIDVFALGYASATMKAIWNNLRRSICYAASTKSIPQESVSSAIHWAAITRSSRLASTAGSRPSSHHAALTRFRRTTTATSLAGHTKVTCRAFATTSGSISRKYLSIFRS